MGIMIYFMCDFSWESGGAPPPCSIFKPPANLAVSQYYLLNTYTDILLLLNKLEETGHSVLTFACRYLMT